LAVNRDQSLFEFFGPYISGAQRLENGNTLIYEGCHGRIFEVTRRLYTWAIGKDLVETSPCVGLSKPSPETQRDRVLSEDEIRGVWAACDAELGRDPLLYRRRHACQPPE